MKTTGDTFRWTIFCPILLCLAILSFPLSSEKPVAKATSTYTKRSGGQIAALKKGLAMIHADLHFKIFPDKKEISGIADLTLRARTSRNTIALDLYRVFDIRYIKLNGKKLLPNQYRNPDGLLEINLIDPVKAPLVSQDPSWK